MAEFQFANKAAADVVVIDGHRYIVGPTTRSSLRALDRINEAEDDGDRSAAATERRAQAFIEFIGLRLASENGAAPAGAVLAAAWESDSAGIEDLVALAEFIAGAEADDADPPPKSKRSTSSGSATSAKRRAK